MVAGFAVKPKSSSDQFDSVHHFKGLLKKLSQNLNSLNSILSEDAALHLAQIGFPAVNLLMDALMSQTTHVAVNAARALGIMGSDAKSAVLNLVWVLQHPDVERRQSAASALGRIKTNPAVSVQALAKALRDKEHSVRQYASAALGEFDGDALSCVIEELQFAVTDEDENVRNFSKYALSKVEVNR